jgi:hypothetical protein
VGKLLKSDSIPYEKLMLFSLKRLEKQVFIMKYGKLLQHFFQLRVLEFKEMKELMKRCVLYGL